MAAASGDPRVSTGPEATADAGVRPIVARPGGGPPLWMLGAGLAAFAVLLFIGLDARRRALQEPSPRPQPTASLAQSAAPAPLFIPPAEAPPLPVRVVAPPDAVIAPLTPRPVAPVAPQIIYVPQPTAPAPIYIEPSQPPTPPPSTAPALVVDVGGGTAAPAGTAAASATASPPLGSLSSYGGRARAGALANRATTIPQGALIPAVLETALDTSRPGLARAVVSRDVRGFDGTRVLVPRGSRLIGDYRADAAPGQRRVAINWTRLVRPDGVTIALDSPSGDPVGRAGTPARASDNAVSRFLGSALRTVVDVGLAVVGRRTQQTVIVANGADAAVRSVQPETPTRSLSVSSGASITVMVARDLDFTGVESVR